MATDAEQDTPLTYDTATPEQVSAARVEARRKLADAETRRTPERRERLRALLGIPADR